MNRLAIIGAGVAGLGLAYMDAINTYEHTELARR